MVDKQFKTYLISMYDLRNYPGESCARLITQRKFIKIDIFMNTIGKVEHKQIFIPFIKYCYIIIILYFTYLSLVRVLYALWHATIIYNHVITLKTEYHNYRSERVKLRIRMPMTISILRQKRSCNKILRFLVCISKHFKLLEAI